MEESLVEKNVCHELVPARSHHVTGSDGDDDEQFVRWGVHVSVRQLEDHDTADNLRAIFDPALTM